MVAVYHLPFSIVQFPLWGLLSHSLIREHLRSGKQCWESVKTSFRAAALILYLSSSVVFGFLIKSVDFLDHIKLSVISVYDHTPWKTEESLHFWLLKSISYSFLLIFQIRYLFCLDGYWRKKFCLWDFQSCWIAGDLFSHPCYFLTNYTISARWVDCEKLKSDDW